MKISLSDSLNDLLIALEKFLKENSILDQSAKKIVYIINNEEQVLDQIVQIIDIKLNPSAGDKNEAKTKQLDPVSISELNFEFMKTLSMNKSGAKKEADNCTICMDAIENPKTLDKCGHTFCQECIDEYFRKVKKNCPVCNKTYGIR